MKEKNQKQIWNNIAKEWHEFKIEKDNEINGFLRKQKGNILDLGSGSGRYMAEITKGKMYLVDFSEEMIKLAEKRAKDKKIKAEFFVCDFSKEKLPFKDNFFNSAIAIASLHCIQGSENRKFAVKELNRVLKKNSEVKVTVWNKTGYRFIKGPKERMVNWRDKGKRYYYIFDAEEIYNLFEKNGFEITEKIEPGRNIIFTARKI